MTRRYSPEMQQTAKQLYVRGYTILEIERETGVNARTLYNWRDDNAWDTFCPPDTIETAIARRINILAEREQKTAEELAEFTALTKNFGNLKIELAKAKLIEAQANALASGRSFNVGVPGEAVFFDPQGRGECGGVSGTRAARHNNEEKTEKRKKKAPKNDISGITPEMLDDARRNHLFKDTNEKGEEVWRGVFDYQELWYEHRNDRIRLILKSRQIGATAYFAFEALDRSIRTAENCIFLSASRDQAEVFKAYIIAYAKNCFDVELKGQGVIILSNGAELRFLSTNSNTAQSYHGHLYIDEVFWIPNYKKLNKVSSGMASHKKWRITKFSTPSAISHEAYAEWSGEMYNQRRADNNKAEFDISHKGLKDGAYGPDKKWRNMVTVEDAEAQGCDLFDIEQLKDEFSEDDFANLYMCKFIDDSQSIFKLSKLLECTVDVDQWPDYKPEAARPFANKPVALGYDPSRTRDNASLAALAIPLIPGEAWRVLRTDSYHGQNFQYQSNRIKDVRDTHNVQFIGIDTTGIGHGVFELVQVWYPAVTPIHYSMEMKTKLVVKALDVIENNRLKYKAGDHEITRAFLMISKTTTGSGQITYASNRSTEAGHADVAWSIMHALQYEPIDNNARKSTATFSN
ncbi:terminase family protein [Methylomonas sp. EFPC1]|uniref:terminase large subunit domain-containing protein n=1 Tax=Methylomonas sp. EFPC1 TaxID=2812647 RepID=UPI001967F7A3|nr:terminase family protein [Methylomonas sp. EFPC1]QSB01983.1 terminase family protein [Methylomonas sp. EFPC1]